MLCDTVLFPVVTIYNTSISYVVDNEMRTFLVGPSTLQKIFKLRKLIRRLLTSKHVSQLLATETQVGVCLYIVIKTHRKVGVMS